MSTPSQTPAPSPTATDEIVGTETYFEGWFTRGTATAPLLCATTESFSLQQSGTLARCCAEDCAFATTCIDNTLSYDDGDTQYCGSAYSCVTVTILSTPGPDPRYPSSHILCGQRWDAFTIYRTLPESASAEPTFSETQTDKSPKTSSADDDGNNGSPLTGGGIAGTVVGGISLIALFAIGFWFIRRRLQRKNAASSFASPGQPYHGGYQPYTQSPNPPGWNQLGVPGYSGQQQQHHGYMYQPPAQLGMHEVQEMPAGSSPRELGVETE